jgi:hypothetical protein
MCMRMCRVWCLRSVLPKSSVLLHVLLWAKGFNANYIFKEIFPVYGLKRLSREGVHNWFQKFSQGRPKIADDARSGGEVAETTARILLCCWPWRAGKAVGQVYQCWWRICREMNVFFQVRSHILRFIAICDLFTDYPSYIPNFRKIVLQPKKESGGSSEMFRLYLYTWLHGLTTHRIIIFTILSFSHISLFLLLFLHLLPYIFLFLLLYLHLHVLLFNLPLDS